jgi:hypothetical protein
MPFIAESNVLTLKKQLSYADLHMPSASALDGTVYCGLGQAAVTLLLCKLVMHANNCFYLLDRPSR